MTFNELRLNTIRAAQNLQKRGFQSRQVFSFMNIQPSEHIASIVLASFCLACPIAPLHSLMSKEEMISILAKTKPSVMFCDESAYEETSQILKELNFDVKFFIFGRPIDDLETVESLFVETGNESNFV